jgi:tRNA (guanine37-N1)-methyltransferase
MIISIATLFPELYTPFFSTSLLKRACQQGIIDTDISTLFEYVAPKERIDAPTFGHNAGMLIKPEVVESAVNAHESRHGRGYRIFFSPHGKKLDQRLAQKIAVQWQKTGHLLLIPARYEGIDARAEEVYADEIVSLGDFVLMGGDIPAMALIEAVARFIPGIIGNQQSVELDSFSSALVDNPEYTVPAVWKDKAVPEVIRSGDHKKIREWAELEAARRTIKSHFDWFRKHASTKHEYELAEKVMPCHYAALMHNEINLPGDRIGTTSVTSLDIHDIARSARTYGLKGYGLITSLLDQQKIVRRLLDFWQHGEGIEYNPHRHEALDYVYLHDSLSAFVEQIERSEGVKPVIIATSALSQSEVPTISFHDQELVWKERRPVLLLFGTGRGLSSQVLSRCDYILTPLAGLSAFNHLSVRSAAAIVFDRWLGLNPVR